MYAIAFVAAVRSSTELTGLEFACLLRFARRRKRRGDIIGNANGAKRQRKTGIGSSSKNGEWDGVSGMEAMEREAEKMSVAVATPLARSVAEQAVGTSVYHGVRTVTGFGDSDAELRAALTDAVAHDMGWRRRITVTGEDRMRWLSGMVTNHVAGLEDGASNYNLVLNAQGRIQGDCCVWRGSDASLELEMDEDQREALVAHLERFIIMDDVELKPRDGWTALGLAGPQAAAVLQRALEIDLSAMKPGMWRSTALRGASETGVETSLETSVEVRRETGRLSGHWELWCRERDVWAAWLAMQAAGAQAAGCEALERLRIVEGMPAFGVDIGGDTLPQETALNEALHFSKGCYLGQEIVERIHSRGQVHRHVRALQMFPVERDPEAGMELSRTDAAEKSVAKVTSVASVEMDGARRWFALGMVRAEADAAELQYAGGSARVLRGAAVWMTKSKETE